MTIFFFTSILFCFAILLQIIIWHIKVPSGKITALCKIFILVLVFGLALARIFSGYFIWLPHDLAGFFYIILFYAALVIAYIGNYPVVEVDSPSFLIIKLIAGSGPNGLSREALNKIMSDDLLIKPRIEDLIKAKMAIFDDEKYMITKKGILFVSMFIFFRKIINLPKGG